MNCWRVRRQPRCFKCLRLAGFKCRLSRSVLAPICLCAAFGEGKAAAGLRVVAFPGPFGAWVWQTRMCFSGWCMGWEVAWEHGGIFVKCVEYPPPRSFRKNDYSHSLV